MMNLSPIHFVRVRGLASLLTLAAALVLCLAWAVQDPPALVAAQSAGHDQASASTEASDSTAFDLAAFERPIWGEVKGAGTGNGTGVTETAGALTAFGWRFLGLSISGTGETRAILYAVETKEIIKVAAGEVFGVWRIESISQELVVLNREDGASRLHIDPDSGSVQQVASPTAAAGEIP
jgi:hypothetical protein